jgi:hypothetical protein
MVSDIPTGDGKNNKLFLQCGVLAKPVLHSIHTLINLVIVMDDHMEYEHFEIFSKKAVSKCT